VDLLAQLGVGMYMGVSGTVDEILEALCSGELIDGQSMCEH